MTQLALLRGPRLAFTVPGAPVPKGRPRSWVKPDGTAGRPFTPARTKHYEQAVGLWAQRALSAAGLSHTWPMGEFYEVTLRIYRARNAGDADNFQKCVGDGLEPVLFENDRNVRKWAVEMFVDRAEPRVEVVVDVVYREARR